MVSPPEGVIAWLGRHAVEIVELDVVTASPADADALVTLAQARTSDAIVVDGYAFGPDYVSAVRRRTPVVLVDDEGTLDHYDADIVLNQNLHASQAMYRRRAPGTRLLLGTTFVLLRPEFLAWESWQREFSVQAKTCVLTFGGSDGENATAAVLDSLLSRDSDMLTRVIVGQANPNVADLRRLVDGARHVDLLVGVDDMAAQLAWADVAVASAGSTCWELAYMGLPGVLIPLAENQQPIARELDRLGAAVHSTASTAGDAVALLAGDEARRRAISASAKRVVDGKGARRVVDAIRGLLR
jgi:UDP-2,4-diacetamido-2,4,6-trideoxy-beta-L-altropyranose hydrolase